MKKKIDKLVEVASFPTPNDSDILESMFQEAGIDYSMENVNSATVIPGVDIRLMVREEDVAKSVRLIKQAGYESYLSDIE